MKLRLALLIAWVPLWAFAQEKVDLNTITKVEVKGGSVEITGNKKPNFTTFTMTDPPRLVIDISEAVFSGVPEEMQISNGTVTAIKTASYGSDAAAIARVLIGFERDVETDIQTVGETRLVVKVAGSGAPAVAAAEPVKEDKAGAAQVAAAQEKAAQEKAAKDAQAQADTQKAAQEKVAAAQAEKDKKAQAKAEKEAAAKAEKERIAQEKAEKLAAAKAAKEQAAQEKAEKLAAAKAEKERLAQEKQAAKEQAAQEKAEKLAAAKAAKEQAAQASAGDQAAAKPAAEEKAAAARAAAEEKAAKAEEKKNAAQKAKEERAAAAQAAAEEKAAKAEEKKNAAQKAKEEKAAAAQAAAEEKAAKAEEKKQVAQKTKEPAQPQAVASAEHLAPPQSGGEISVSGRRKTMQLVGFKQDASASRVFVRTNEPVRYSVSEAGDKTLVLELENTRIQTGNDHRPLDTSYFDTAVAMVTPNEGPTKTVRIQIKLKESVAYQAHQNGNEVSLEFSKPGHK